MKIMILCLLLFVACGQSDALENMCTKTEAIEAEQSVVQLSNWKEVYTSFKKFGHCDDGAIAEGYSEVVVNLLAKHWDQIGELIKITEADGDFFKFVLRHIDTTTKRNDIAAIAINCVNSCPASSLTQCSVIEKTAKKTLSEFNE